MNKLPQTAYTTTMLHPDAARVVRCVVISSQIVTIKLACIGTICDEMCKLCLQQLMTERRRVVCFAYTPPFRVFDNTILRTKMRELHAFAILAIVMKKQVFHVHGGESFDQYDDFLEWLRTVELWHLPKEGEDTSQKSWTHTFQEALGDTYEVIAPRMPNSQNAKYDEWKIWFERHFDYLKDGVVLTGLSLGAMFLAKYLSENKLPFNPSAVMLLAGAYDISDENVPGCGDFLMTPESLTSLTRNGYPVYILHSKDDFVVPYEHGVALSKALTDATFMQFEDKNHFLVETFPELIDLIQSL